MDRRYKQARFYNGTPATDRSVNKSDSLVRSYLARARQQNATDQSYGGSTETPDRNKVFKEEGSGVYGARRAKYESRMLPDLGT